MSPSKWCIILLGVGGFLLVPFLFATPILVEDIALRYLGYTGSSIITIIVTLSLTVAGISVPLIVDWSRYFPDCDPLFVVSWYFGASGGLIFSFCIFVLRG